MTAPADISFVDGSGQVPEPVSQLVEPTAALAESTVAAAKTMPDPIVPGLTDERRTKLCIWLDEWLLELERTQANRHDAWKKIEESYKGEDAGDISKPPFVGACMDVIPVIAMAVDPIHARLDTSIFKQDPVFAVKALTKDMTALAPSVSKFIDFYQRHRLELRRVSSPRLLETAKLGTCVFKVVRDKETRRVVTYDDNFEVVKRDDVVFVGPRVLGISVGDFLFPPGYQHVQACPIVAERQRVTMDTARILQHRGYWTDVDKIEGTQAAGELTPLEAARQKAVGREEGIQSKFVVVYEAWCDYDINGDGLPERMVVTYEPRSRTLLQVRYNWYFHQLKPYVVIPYTVSNETLEGVGIGEMTRPFQLAFTRFHRMASDNAYLANIRMFIGRKNIGLEEIPKLYTGKTFLVDEPTKDFIPFQAGDIYPSTISERANLMGLVEKRTGVNDYLTGRESPIIGTRATATSTLALIREGMARVEEVLENLRAGYSEIIQFCMSIWIQFGTDGLEDKVFGDDQIAKDIKQFFALAGHENVNGLIGIELTATDPSTTRAAMQQMQLSIIQVMMQYLEKVLTAGQAALQAQAAGVPEYAEMVKEVMRAARQMFGDLLKNYDNIRNPDDYLPDLEKYLNVSNPMAAAAGGPGAGPPGAGGAGGAGGVASVPVVPRSPAGPPVPRPAVPGASGGSPILQALTGGNPGA